MKSPALANRTSRILFCCPAQTLGNVTPHVRSGAFLVHPYLSIFLTAYRVTIVAFPQDLLTYTVCLYLMRPCYVLLPIQHFNFSTNSLVASYQERFPPRQLSRQHQAPTHRFLEPFEWLHNLTGKKLNFPFNSRA